MRESKEERHETVPVEEVERYIGSEVGDLQELVPDCFPVAVDARPRSRLDGQGFEVPEYGLSQNVETIRRERELQTAYPRSFKRVSGQFLGQGF